MIKTSNSVTIKGTVSRLGSKVKDHEKRKELRFNALLSEMQNASTLVENHSRVSLVLSTGLLALATTEGVVSVPTWALAILGGGVILIWLIKISRHKQISDYCHKKLKIMDSTAIRPAPKPWMHGFNLMYALVFVVILAWVGVFLL